MLGLCWAYFSQERYVMPNRAYVELMLGPFWPHVGQC